MKIFYKVQSTEYCALDFFYSPSHDIRHAGEADGDVVALVDAEAGVVALVGQEIAGPVFSNRKKRNEGKIQIWQNIEFAGDNQCFLSAWRCSFNFYACNSSLSHLSLLCSGNSCSPVSGGGVGFSAGHQALHSGKPSSGRSNSSLGRQRTVTTKSVASSSWLSYVIRSLSLSHSMFTEEPEYKASQAFLRGKLLLQRYCMCCECKLFRS